MENLTVTRSSLNTMPQFRKDNLSKFTLDLVDMVFRQPGEEEKYQEWLRNRKATQIEKTTLEE